MATKNLLTRVTAENLAAELKKKFNVVDTQLSQALKSGKVEGNTVKLFTSADATGTAAFSFDFPVEMVLDQAKTAFVPAFTWAEATYPGSTDPSMNGKPVMVLAVKGSDNSVAYSFMDMATLVDTYKAKTEGKDGSTTVTISGYEVDVAVKISAAEGNALVLKDDGLYVTSPKVTGATNGNLAGLGADGTLTDSGVAASKIVTEDDISDFTSEEIAALLSSSTGA